MKIPQDIEVVILAGGLGTRLRSVAPVTPKPLVEVAGQPFLLWQLDWLKRNGCCDIVISVGYRADDFAAVIGDGKRAGLCVRHSREDNPMGTAGALRLARPLLRADVVVVQNGDTYCDFDLAAAVSMHRIAQSSITIVVTEVEDVSRFGSVAFDKQCVIQGFHEKVHSSGKGFVNAGTYIFSTDQIEKIPAGKVWSLEKDFFPQLCADQAFVAYPVSAPLIDIGTPESLAAARSLLTHVM